MSHAAVLRGNPGIERGGLVGDALTAKRLWLLIAAFEMALTLLSTYPGDVRKPLLNLSAGFVSSAFLLGVVGLGWFLILRHLSGTARVVAALPVIVLAGAVRGCVLQWLLVSWDMSLPGIEGYRYRVFGSIVVVVTGAVSGALVKVNVEAHRRRLEELDALQTQLSLVLAQAEVRLRADQSDVVTTITGYLAEQLAQVRAASPDVAIDSLEHMAADIVRPLSHDLAAAAPSWSPPEPESLARRLDWSEVWSAIASPGSMNPLGPAVVTLIVTPSTAVAFGFSRGLLVHVCAAALIFVGLLSLRSAFPAVAPQRSTPQRLALTTALLVLACVPAAVATWFLSIDPLREVNAAYVLLVVPIVALMFAFIGAARAQQRATEQMGAAVVAETQWWVTRTRLVQWWQNAALARALHGPVQSVIGAAAQRLRAAVASGDAQPAVIQAVLTDASASLSEIVMASHGGEGFQSRLDNVTATWRPLVKLEQDVADSALEVIDQDTVCAEILVDVVAEAVSNAVRHGGARHLKIKVAIADAGGHAIAAAIIDDGRGRTSPPDASGVTPGLGTTQLDTCALRWEYANVEGANQLAVALPVLSSSLAEVMSAR